MSKKMGSLHLAFFYLKIIKILFSNCVFKSTLQKIFFLVSYNQVIKQISVFIWRKNDSYYFTFFINYIPYSIAF